MGLGSGKSDDGRFANRPYDTGMGKIMKPYSEHAFETAIEHHLTTAGGYVKGDRETFDPARALFPAEVIAFIQASQPKEWEYLFGKAVLIRPVAAYQAAERQPGTDLQF